MATASRLDCLGVFPSDGDIRLQSQAAMLVITLGMVSAMPGQRCTVLVQPR
jgi:hypothetical protein